MTCVNRVRPSPKAATGLGRTKLIYYSQSIVYVITTIQLNDEIKRALSRLKQNERDTYEDVIVRMMREARRRRNKSIDLLEEGYREMARTSIETTQEWSAAESTWDR